MTSSNFTHSCVPRAFDAFSKQLPGGCDAGYRLVYILSALCHCELRWGPYGFRLEVPWPIFGVRLGRKRKRKCSGEECWNLAFLLRRHCSVELPIKIYPTFPWKFLTYLGFLKPLGHRLHEYPKISNIRKFYLDYKLGQRILWRHGLSQNLQNAISRERRGVTRSLTTLWIGNFT